MNKQDRTNVAAITARIEQAKSEITAAGEELRALAEAEQEKFDNMSEGLQAGEQGQAIEKAAEVLDEAASAADEGNAGEALTALEEINS